MFIAAATAPVWLTVVLAIPPSLIAIVAIVVGRRQQEATLRHEREQQRDRLAHERELTDLHELRSLLDQCARALYQARERMSDVASAPDDEPSRQKTREAADVLVELWQRLGIRLGVGEPLAVRFAASVDAALAFTGAAHMWVLRHGERDAFTEIQATRSRFDDARDEFVAEASRRAGVRLPEQR